LSASKPDRSPLEFSREEMRRLGHALVDAVVDRWDGLEEAAPWAGASRSELEPRFREPCPEGPGDVDAAMKRAVEEILPLAGRIDHPRFMAFVPASPTWPSLMGDWLAAGFNIFQGTWLESAGPSQIELVVLEWMREWIGMPEGGGGLLTSGGSAANLTAAVAARQAAVDRGGSLDHLTAYVGSFGHSSLERALRIAGYPSSGIRVIDSDEQGRMRVDLLEKEIAADRAAGRMPAVIAATAGATSTGAVDPLPELVRLAAREEIWLHVDAAYGGFAILSEEGAQALQGLGEVDTVTLDPHKWLFQTYEAGCLLARDPQRLENAFKVFPDYLQDTELGMEHVNFGNRGLQLTRRFRALKIWMTLQAHGKEALAEAISAGIALGHHAEARVHATEELEVLTPSSLGILCFRARPLKGMRRPEVDEWNRRIQDLVVSEGTAMISSTRINGDFSLRICPMNYRTRPRHVDQVVDRIQQLAALGPDGLQELESAQRPATAEDGAG